MTTLEACYITILSFANIMYRRMLTMEEERALAVFETKILRKIYGPMKGNLLCRIRRNDELEAIIKGENFFLYICTVHPQC
jgi:hypothetical protein